MSRDLGDSVRYSALSHIDRDDYQCRSRVEGDDESGIVFESFSQLTIQYVDV